MGPNYRYFNKSQEIRKKQIVENAQDQDRTWEP